MNFELQELDLNSIGPNIDDLWSKKKPSKIVIIGRPFSGKTALLKYILFYFRHVIGQGIVLSGTEDITQDLSNHFPSLFVYNKYDEKPIKKLIENQKRMIQAKVSNPWSILILDDVACEKKFFMSPLQQELFKNSRHYYILYILTIQYVMDLPPTIRATTDAVFVFRESNVNGRKTIFTNYASFIPTFALFNNMMDDVAKDHTCLYFNNMHCSDDWTKNVKYFKAPLIERPWKFGNKDFWKYHYYYFERDDEEEEEESI